MASTGTIEARFTVRGGPEVRVFRVSGRECISQLYSFEVDFVVDGSSDASTETFLNANATLSFVSGGEEVRRVQGVIVGVEEEIALDAANPAFRVRLAPRLHLLTMVSIQDIFTETSFPDLVRGKLERYGLHAGSDFELMGLLANHGKRDFIVQFQESDLAFLSRWAEHLGVSFYFEDTDGGDKVVFVDDNGGFPVLKGHETIHLGASSRDRGVQRLRAVSETIPTRYGVHDYNYRTPDVELAEITASQLGFAGGVIEWGSHVKTPEEAAALSAVRAQEYESQQLRFHGESNLCELSAGHRTTLDGPESRQLLVVEVEHHLTQSAAMTGTPTEEPEYRNHFRAALADRTYRPPRVTPKPRIPGLIGGVIEPTVPGEVDRYAQIDEHGRYTVKFFFDSMQLDNRKASHPVRKAQPTAGPDYGMHFPLRPGIEVVIGFINGDPDRPIILGAVHNAKTPAHVRSTPDTNVIKSASGIKMTFKDN